jgi:stearoyl-CoA desaturase (delta-9 desaturase)
MYFGLLDLPWWGYVLATLGMTHITIVSITIYLHRHQAHRALDLHPALAHFFRFWLWLTTGTVTEEWVAVHRKHHSCVESGEDPHSPKVFGIKRLLLEGAELYRTAAADPETIAKYNHGCPDDWLERNVYKPLTDRGYYLMLVIDVVLFGPIGITIWAVQMAWQPVFAAGVINGVCHHTGYRNFETPDASTNFVPWGILIGGEELHNNHHTYPSSAKFSVKWWEIDVGWAWIKVFSWLGLVRIKRLPPEVLRIEGKHEIDLDTIRAVISDRFRVMARYRRMVVEPIARTELERAEPTARDILDRAKSLLWRTDALDNDDERELRSRLLHCSDTLRTIYEKRVELQRLWEMRTANIEELAGGLRDWCRKAEESGIASLREFSEYLRTYAGADRHPEAAAGA